MGIFNPYLYPVRNQEEMQHLHNQMQHQALMSMAAGGVRHSAPYVITEEVAEQKPEKDFNKLLLLTEENNHD